MFNAGEILVRNEPFVFGAFVAYFAMHS